MLRVNQIKLPLNHDEAALTQAVIRVLQLAPDELLAMTIYRRAFDARNRRDIQLVYSLDIEVRDEQKLLQRISDRAQLRPTPNMEYQPVAQAPAHVSQRPIVIGTGPCGIFAALILAQMGFKPLVLERGKAVRERTQDTWAFWRKGQLNPESNAQFGEGGAGTFSDGKLFSQIKDPKFHGRKVLTEFVKAGAPEEILYLSHPHIGTFRLVRMIENMRASIEALGGEIRFGSQVTDLLIDEQPDGRQIQGVVLASGEQILSQHVVLAIGHSARDSFYMLHQRGVYLEAKPFSIGVRIEHPQSLVDKARFGNFAGHPLLGAAEYKLVHHASNQRTAYSFCMCPGGTVVAATSELERVATNGMSQYSRNERNANSGIVVNISPEVDYPGHPLAGVEFQRHWESQAFIAGGSDYSAPAQLVGDFLANRPSHSLGQVKPSYRPGIHLTDLRQCLPDFVSEALQQALPAFARQLPGFAMNDALMTGVETRTSSPVRIRRGDDYQSLNTRGLYPAGEGAGYAGGIFSAGIDGIKIAEAVALNLTGQTAEGGSRQGGDWG